MFLAPWSRGRVFQIDVNWFAKLRGELCRRYNILIPKALGEINALIFKMLLCAIFFYFSLSSCLLLHSWRILTLVLLLSCLLYHLSVCCSLLVLLMLLSREDIFRFRWTDDRIITHVAQLRWLNFTNLLLAQRLREISATIVSWRITSKVLILKRPHRILSCLYLYLGELWPFLL